MSVLVRFENRFVVLRQFDTVRMIRWEPQSGSGGHVRRRGRICSSSITASHCAGQLQQTVGVLFPFSEQDERASASTVAAYIRA